MTAPRLLRRREVEDRVGLRRSEIYRRIAEGTFPKPLRLGARCVRWPEPAVDAWITSHLRAAEQTTP
jgi:prophage regulatory protein